MKYILATFFIFLSLAATAQPTEGARHKLLRRLAVFPVKASAGLSDSAEDSWWRIRELITGDKRFLVASKNFLKKKDVFQARSRLEPADAIILGELLDAQGIVVSYLQNRKLTMSVYEGEFGRRLWEKSLNLHPSLPIAKQLVEASERLTNDFLASVPYQGFVVEDELVGQTVYEKDGVYYVKAQIGEKAQVDKGDKVQIIRVEWKNFDPLFTGGGLIEVYAEGKVFQEQRNHVVIELLRVSNLTSINEGSLVRFPKEYKRLQKKLSMKEKLAEKVNPEYFSPEMSEIKQNEREKKPLVTSLSFLVGLAVFLVLAF